MHFQGGLEQDTIAVVLAGGKGARLGSLTRRTCKPALPFGAVYRNIDFTLSNCVNSGVRRIGVATQHQPEALVRHMGSVWGSVCGMPDGFISAWPAQLRAPGDGYRGTADAVYRNFDRVERSRSALVLILAGDHVYRMDYRPMLDFHVRRGADVTVACVEVAKEAANQFGVLATDSRGRIRDFVEKPVRVEASFAGDRVLASMGIYVFSRRFLARVLCRDARAAGSRHDFGGDILPKLVARGNAFAYGFLDRSGQRPGYWRDVGTPEAYWRAHMDLLDEPASLGLDDCSWPLRPGQPRSAVGAKPLAAGARPVPHRSLVADGATIAGTLRHSVVFERASIAAGALVEDSVILPGAVIGRDCRVVGGIVDSDCVIPDGTVVDGGESRRPGGDGPAVLAADCLPREPVRLSA